MNSRNPEHYRRFDQPSSSSSISGRFQFSNSSKKCNGYMLWVQEKGREWFKKKYGYRLNYRDQNDTEKLGEMWQMITEEQRKEYKDRAKFINQNASSGFKTLQSPRRREPQHSIHNLNQIRREHELERRQIQSNVTSRYTVLPRKCLEAYSVPVLEGDIKQRREKDQRHVKASLTFRSMNILNNPIIENENNIFQVISVFPITFSYNTLYNKLLTYPAEIAIMTCNLKSGFLSKESIQVFFDQNAYYGMEANKNNPDFINDAENRDIYAQCFGISSNGPDDGVPPRQVCDWLLEKIVSGAFLLCDINQYTWVTKGLETIAIISGSKYLTRYQNEILRNIVTIQDFAISLLENMHCDGKRNMKWTDNEINHAFRNNYLIMDERKHFYCEFHYHMPAHYRSCKYQCPVAHDARLCHTLFEIFFKNRLQGFARYYGEKHIFCISNDQPVATLPTAPTVELSRESGNNVNKESLCREMLSNSSDSDENNTSVYNQSTGNNAVYLVSKFFGFPQVNFINKSRKRSIIYSINDQSQESGTRSITGPREPSQTLANREEVGNVRKSEGSDNETFLYAPCETRELKIERILDSEESKNVYDNPMNVGFENAHRNNHHPAVKLI